MEKCTFWVMLSLLLILPGVHPTITLAEEQSLLSGAELWEKVIQYHDPAGNWATFEGKVRIMTAFAQGYRVDELLEIRRSDNFYQCTRFAGDIEAVKGIENGECFRAVNGNPEPTEDVIKQYGLTCENTRMSKEHHTGHFGLPMLLKSAGVQVNEEVLQEELQGIPILALRFTGEPGAVAHSYYTGTWMLYIDPETYALRGMQYQQDAESDVYLSRYDGELNIGGVKMAQVQIWYQNDQFWFVSTFTYPQN